MADSDKIKALEAHRDELLEKIESLEDELDAVDDELSSLKHSQRLLAVKEQKKKEDEIDYSKVPVVSPALNEKRKSFNSLFQFLAKEHQGKKVITLQSTMNRLVSKLKEIRRSGTLQDEEQFLELILPDLLDLKQEVWKRMQDLTFKAFNEEI